MKQMQQYGGFRGKGGWAEDEEGKGVKHVVTEGD